MNNIKQNTKSAQDLQDKISELNSKILDITMTIKDEFPELSKYLEEIPETLPNHLNPEITLLNLKTYYETLDTLLKNYILAHANDSVEKIRPLIIYQTVNSLLPKNIVLVQK
ncbi:MAG: hypothetical protein PF517_19815 [Salinivirgaceae bacterium]|jgi:2C-methyl-D-erythritol 2,4-cyclodiphosphate synthase|nr:hypothetical protein [Salinivirgaceae bacterium]